MTFQDRAEQRRQRRRELEAIRRQEQAILFYTETLRIARAVIADTVPICECASPDRGGRVGVNGDGNGSGKIVRFYSCGSCHGVIPRLAPGARQ